MSEALRQIVAAFGVSFDGSGLKQADSSIQGMIGKLKGFAVAAAGAFAIKEVLGFTMGLAEQAVELEHHAEALGISAQSLQKWDFAASLSGVSAEELQIGLQKLQRSAVGAGGKGGDLGATFEKLHVTVKNANGSFKNADELLTDVAGAIGDMTDPTLQTATAMQIFGRGGARLLPFLKQGRAGVEALKAKVEELGGGFTDDFIAKADDMVQGGKDLNFALLGLQVKAMGPLLPILTHLAVSATKFAVSFGDVMKKSNVAKAALIALGVGGTIALAPLLLSIAPLVAGFLLLEDVLTFLTGGDSLTGDLVNKIFGPDATFKVQAFMKALQDDLMPVVHEVWSILTSGEPLDVRLKQLANYVSGTLSPQFKSDFGDMAGSMLKIVSAAGEVAKAIDAIGKAVDDIRNTVEWLINLKKQGLGGLSFSVQDAAMNDQAKNEQIARDNPGKAPSANDYAVEKKPLIQRAVAFLSGFKAEDAVPQGGASLGLTPNVASAPVIGGGSGHTEMSQSIQAPITQQFYGLENAKDVGRAAAKGAEAGLKSGGNDRAQRALVPLSGS